jgi:hypothetical protein
LDFVPVSAESFFELERRICRSHLDAPPAFVSGKQHLSKEMW